MNDFLSPLTPVSMEGEPPPSGLGREKKRRKKKRMGKGGRGGRTRHEHGERGTRTADGSAFHWESERVT